MNDFIYCQRDIPKEQLRYGLRSSAAIGCGWVATYNALKILGYPSEPEKLIRMYERMLPLIHGNGGTAILGPAVAFRRWGFPVNVALRRDTFDRIARESDVCIVFYYWSNKWKIPMGHFVTVRHQDGKFVGYNTYNNSKGPDDWTESIDGFLKKKKYFGAVLIGIRNFEK